MPVQTPTQPLTLKKDAALWCERRPVGHPLEGDADVHEARLEEARVQQLLQRHQTPATSPAPGHRWLCTSTWPAAQAKGTKRQGTVFGSGMPARGLRPAAVST